MTRTATARGAAILFPAALAASAAAHLLLLFLLPYSPERLAAPAREIFPVGIVERPAPATPAPASERIPAAAPEQPGARAAPSAPRVEPALVEAPELEPVPPAPQPKPAPQAEEQTPQSALELAPPEPAATQPAQPAETGGEPLAAVAAGANEAQRTPARAVTGSSPAAAPATVAAATQGTGTSELAAEVSATQAVLSNLRSRIAERIRYPGLARANGWKGTVLLEAMLDSQGRLEGLAVRRSSGYTVLDRAAAALVRSVTPVANPLGKPLRIEIPIVYELKD
jgi:protein TonB